MSALAGRFIAGSQLRQELFASLASVTDFEHGGFGTGEGIGGALSCSWYAGFQLVHGGTRFSARFIRAQERLVHGDARFMNRLDSWRRDGQAHEGVDPLSSCVEIGLPEPFDAVDEEARFVGLVVSAAGCSHGAAEQERRQGLHVGRVRVLLRSLSR